MLLVQAGLIEISQEDEGGEGEIATLQDIQKALSFKDGVLFEQYVGPPAAFASFTAFAGIEEDDAS